MELAFALALALTVYAYAGYPLLVALVAALRPAAPVRRLRAEPAVSVLIVARNEEARLEAKLRSVLALDYPGDRLDVVVVSDGSSDGTEAIAASFASAGVRLLALPGPRGKAACLNAAVPQARGELLLLTDARQPLAADSLRELAAYFADPEVGAVSGELMLETAAGAAASGVGLYWRYEKLIRRAESRLDSTVGATGALYALRRELFVPLDPRTILDDVLLPMEVVLAGRRVLFAPEARAFDRVADDDAHEYRRKVRTLAGNFQLLALRPALLDPRRNRLFFQLVSHKLSRLAVPWCLLVMLLTSAWLAAGGSLFYRSALATQLLLYLLAFAGWRRSRAGRPSRLLALPYSFALLNVAALFALLGFVRGSEQAAWRASS